MWEVADSTPYLNNRDAASVVGSRRLNAVEDFVSHDELIAQGSNLYKKLWEIQAGGFLRED